MKATGLMLMAVFLLTRQDAALAEETTRVGFGAADVFEDFQLTDAGVATLTLNAVISETNNSLRGIRNHDPRRLGKLGQLIYQCKLMLYQPTAGKPAGENKSPLLVSHNFSLFTGVDLELAPGEQVGIRALALDSVDDDSLFTPTLGTPLRQQETWQNLGEGPAVNLQQLDVSLLGDIKLSADIESIDIVIRFPVFQMQQPVNQWSYNFMLEDFRRALEYSNTKCTPARLTALIGKQS